MRLLPLMQTANVSDHSSIFIEAYHQPELQNSSFTTHRRKSDPVATVGTTVFPRESRPTDSDNKRCQGEMDITLSACSGSASAFKSALICERIDASSARGEIFGTQNCSRAVFDARARMTYASSF